MFCTKCGKQLHDGDAFCAHCGTKVREELLFKSEPTTTSYGLDNIVFNPPFKVEADRRTQHIAQEVKPYSSEPKKEAIKLDWNLDGFPAAERKSSEELEFNWDAVIDRKREPKPVTVEKLVPAEEPKLEEKKQEEFAAFETVGASETSAPAEEMFAVKQQQEAPMFETKKEEPLSIEELEKALFGDEDFAKLEPSNDFGLTMQYKHIAGSEKDKLEQTSIANKSEFSEYEEAEALKREFAEAFAEETLNEELKAPVEETPIGDAKVQQTETVAEAAETQGEAPAAAPLEEPAAAPVEAPAAAPLEEPAEAPKKIEENFFTFNAKKDAFQELLDKERARLKALEAQRESQWSEITSSEATEYVPRKVLDFDEVFVEPKLPTTPPVKEVAVVQAPLTARVNEYYEPEVVQAPLTARVEVKGDEAEAAIPSTEAEWQPPFQLEKESTGEQPASEPSAETEFSDTFVEQPAETEETAAPEISTEEKTKLRYSDIFPIDDFNNSDSDKLGKVTKKTEVAEAYNKIFEDDEEDETRGKHGVLKFIIALLAIIVIAEIIIIGAKFIAPDSALTLFVDDLLSKVSLLFE